MTNCSLTECQHWDEQGLKRICWNAFLWDLNTRQKLGACNIEKAKQTAMTGDLPVALFHVCQRKRKALACCKITWINCFISKANMEGESIWIPKLGEKKNNQFLIRTGRFPPYHSWIAPFLKKRLCLYQSFIVSFVCSAVHFISFQVQLKLKTRKMSTIDSKIGGCKFLLQFHFLFSPLPSMLLMHPCSLKKHCKKEKCHLDVILKGWH